MTSETLLHSEQYYKHVVNNSFISIDYQQICVLMQPWNILENKPGRIEQLSW
jgi:hypothetical protein